MLKQKAKVPFRRDQDGTAISITAYDSTKQEAHPQMRHSRASGNPVLRGISWMNALPAAGRHASSKVGV